MNHLVVMLIIALLLGVGVVAGYWNDWFTEQPSVMRTESSSQAVVPLPAVDRNKVQTIEIKDQNGSVKVSRGADGWVLPDSFDAPVMPTRVTGLLDAIDVMNRARKVASKNPHHYEVDDQKGRRLTLTDNSGGVLLDVVVGRHDQVRGGGPAASGTFVRRPGEDAIFRVRTLMLRHMQTTANSWLEKRLVTSIEPAKINDEVAKAKKVILEFDDIDWAPKPGSAIEENPGAFKEQPNRVRVVLERRTVKAAVDDSETGPVPPGTKPKSADNPVDENKWFVVEPEAAKDIDVYTPLAEGVVRSLLYARMENVVGKDSAEVKFGLDKPVLEATVVLDDDTSFNLKVGAEAEKSDEDKQKRAYTIRYAHLAGSPFVVSVNQYSIAQLAKKPDALKTPSRQPDRKVTKPKIKLPGEKGDGDPKKNDG